MEKYTIIVPGEHQKRVQELKFYAFIHYGINSFTDREWGDGKESESLFSPTEQDTDQWCRVIKNAGMKGVILTCKHHDGFCLWQTKTTEHSIKNSPYKNGKGDVVAELSQSCKKYGLRFGVYLSPWDRNSPFYGTPAYNDFYIEQLTELLTDYGDIFMLWLDGACETSMDGKTMQRYDFERIWRTAKKLQPDICLSGCAPDIRWVGNEAGISRKSEWNVVPLFKYEFQNFIENCKGTYEENEKNRCRDILLEDLGSRDVLAQHNQFVWYPAEVDVSIRNGWFYHKSEDDTVKSLDRLMDIYNKSVGGNSLLLLNIPPDTRGLIHENDAERLCEMGREIKKLKDGIIKDAEMSELQKTHRGYEFTVDFPMSRVYALEMEENTDFSQRVEGFEIFANGNSVYNGTVIGFGKLAYFDTVETNRLTVVITESRGEPHMRFAKPIAVG